MARGPVLGLAFLAAVVALAAVARGQRGVGVIREVAADDAPSLFPTASLPMILPMHPLTFDATVTPQPPSASATDSESRRVEGELATTAAATPFSQPIPNPIFAVVARHILGANYLRTVGGTQSDEALAAGQYERA